MSEKLGMDYKTIQHNIRMLINEKIITTDDRKKYGSMHFLDGITGNRQLDVNLFTQ